MVKEQISTDITQAITALQKKAVWPVFELPEFTVEVPPDSTKGDFASNVALVLAKPLKKSPMDIAKELQAELPSSLRIEIAPPGFLNFFLSEQVFSDVVQHVLTTGETYGQQNIGKGQHVLLEFISANPTGPLTLPNGRGGYLGDVLSNVHDALGYTVSREFYINDRGRQVDILGESVLRRFMQQQGMEVEFDEELYQGEYINELAEKIDIDEHALQDTDKRKKDHTRVKEIALKMMITEIQRVVTDKMRIHYTSWFSEKSLYERGIPEKMLETLKEKDAVYEQDGALWLRTSQYGDDKDRVLIKKTGDGAYLQGDVSLFYDRSFVRNVDKVILILGADHHGYERRLKAIPPLLQSKTVFDLIFTQMATLLRQGKEVRMSKRKGNFVTIEELIDEVGNDVTRFFFLMYSADRHMNFDLDLAKEQSDKNPVFYVQYAYARMSSIIREVEQKHSGEQPATISITHEAEKELVKQLMHFPELLQTVSASYEVHHLTAYALDLARAFHHFYAHCRVLDNDEVNGSRYALVQATKIVLGRTLQVLGVAAPERM